MNSKQVYDLTLEDLDAYNIWVFPMDETVRNEASVRPLLADEAVGERQAIVKTCFVGSEGSEYVGYIYWANSNEVRYLQPVLFVRNEYYITFWNGMEVPSWDDGPSEVKALKKVLPISYSSETHDDLPSVAGLLEGLYYRDRDKKICCVS